MSPYFIKSIYFEGFKLKVIIGKSDEKNWSKEVELTGHKILSLIGYFDKNK